MIYIVQGRLVFMYNGRVYKDRRKGPDFCVKWIKWAGYFLWIIAVTVILMADKARPPIETFFDRLFKIHLRKTWNTELMKYAFYLLILLFLTCIFTIIINSRRHRRKTDRYNPSVIVLSILSLIGMIIYICTS